jgi:hypothetical protein
MNQQSANAPWQRDGGLTENSILLLFLSYLIPKRENPIYINKDENPSTISTRYANINKQEESQNNQNSNNE